MANYKIIKQIRLGLCMTQKEFAKALGVSTATSSAWEAGSRAPGFTNCRKLIQFGKKIGLTLNIWDIRDEA